MKINSKSFFNYYIIHPFSKKLPATDQAVAAVASTILLLPTLGILHGRAYLKGRKTKQQNQQQNPHIKPATPPKPTSPKSESHLPAPIKRPPRQEPKPNTPLRTQFEAGLDQMGSHILPYQRQTLLSLFDLALRSDDPNGALAQGIDAKINQPDGWGNDKALHLKRNLLPLMAKNDSRPLPPSSPVLKIAQNPIDAQGNKLVCFYKTGPTEFLGNFSICPRGLNIWGRRFQCSEAAFQWRKYQLAGIQDPKMNEFFQADGEKAFQLNRYFENTYKNQFAPGWRNGVRDQAMWDVLEAKFSQNPEFKRLLDETKGAYLLEHNQASRDNYWSDNHDGSGKNMLGKMLMAIRDGQSKPPVDDAKDGDRVRNFAIYANRSLNYTIF
jgi:ribA/ribD-fused uncharacterized protein